jgi:hypothetical protein
VGSLAPEGVRVAGVSDHVWSGNAVGFDGNEISTGAYVSAGT